MAFFHAWKGGKAMAAGTKFDYYYGDESSQFSFYRIPRQLITSGDFKGLSTDAKLLYDMLLDRMGLSAKHGWYDSLGRVYIYTLEEIQRDLNCGHNKATKLLVELDNGKQGFGLIERVKQGQGRPTKIYVKRFTTRAVPPPPPEPPQEPDPRPRISSGQDCGFSAGNYIESNQTDFSYPDPSIHPPYPLGPPLGIGWMDRSERRESVKAGIEYESLCRQYGREDVDEAVELITEALCSARPTIRVNGEEIPTAQVKARFLTLDREHVSYVLESMVRSTSDIRNIRAYLLTVLYNAPATINSHYQAEVRRDWGR